METSYKQKNNKQKLLSICDKILNNLLLKETLEKGDLEKFTLLADVLPNDIDAVEKLATIIGKAENPVQSVLESHPGEQTLFKEFGLEKVNSKADIYQVVHHVLSDEEPKVRSGVCWLFYIHQCSKENYKQLVDICLFDDSDEVVDYALSALIQCYQSDFSDVVLYELESLLSVENIKVRHAVVCGLLPKLYESKKIEAKLYKKLLLEQLFNTNNFDLADKTLFYLKEFNELHFETLAKALEWLLSGLTDEQLVAYVFNFEIRICHFPSYSYDVQKVLQLLIDVYKRTGLLYPHYRCQLVSVIDAMGVRAHLASSFLRRQLMIEKGRVEQYAPLILKLELAIQNIQPKKVNL